MTIEKFVPTEQKLISLIDLEKSAIVTETDIKNAITEWENDPPLKGFEKILQAETTNEINKKDNNGN